MEEKICGIYKITNPSNKVYIGQSKNIIERFKGYKKLYGKTNRQIKLYNSIKKYGFENHIFEIIEECIFDNLNTRERYWQDYYDVTSKNGLNLLLVNTNEKPRIYSKETRDRMSIGAKNKNYPSEETRRKISESNRGKKHSVETKRKLSIAHKGKIITEEHRKNLVISHLGKVLPLETREKMSRSHKGINTWMKGRPVLQSTIDKRMKTLKNMKASYKPIVQLDLKGNFIREWDCAYNAGRGLNIFPQNICKCCKGVINTYKKSKWMYLKDYKNLEGNTGICEELPKVSELELNPSLYNKYKN